MTDKDQLERLKWQVTQETGLRAQMTERMEKAEKAAGVLRHDLKAALHDIEAVARASNDVIMRLRSEGRDTIKRLRAKAKQQLGDSLNAEGAMKRRAELAERNLASALTAKRTGLDRCTVLQTERDELRARLESKNPLPGSR